MEWQTVALSLDEIAAGDHARLKKEFTTSFMLSGAPRSARLLARQVGRSHLAFYFSPEAAAIFDIGLARWSARPCPEPPEDGLTLVVGHKEVALEA